MAMLRFFYSSIYFCAIPALLLRLLWRSRRNLSYRHGLSQRLGFSPRLPKKRTLWLHAVSLGESVAASPLIKQLITRFPDYNLLISNTTATGHDYIKNNFGQQVAYCYLPFDLPFTVARFFQRNRIVAGIIMETELWPNLMHYAKRHAIPMVLANARLSERSAKQYGRIPTTARSMLNSLSTVVAQSNDDAQRFASLGLDSQRLLVGGNLKFDLELDPSLSTEAALLRQDWHSVARPCVIAASTHEGEEAAVLQSFAKVRQQLPNALLILVPRHPERFARVKQLCLQQGFTLAQRSLQQNPKDTAVYLGDTMGELKLLYASADVAFVGGTLMPIGGHNLIEPAALGLAVVCGPHTENCSDIANTLQRHRALNVVQNAAALGDTLLELLQNPSMRQLYADNAKKVVEQSKGALQRHMDAIQAIMPSSVY